VLFCIGRAERKMRVALHKFLRPGSQSNGAIANAVAASVQAMVRT
jgi:hypothetical protein